MYFQKCVQNPKTKGMPLSSFLLKPMQRITKYPLIVEKVGVGRGSNIMALILFEKGPSAFVWNANSHICVHSHLAWITAKAICV